MYKKFYKLKRDPFALGATVHYLYLSKPHKEALRFLTSCVTGTKGNILLLGDAGSGKTTVIQAFLTNLDKRLHFAHLRHPNLSETELLNQLIHAAFEKTADFQDEAEPYHAFKKLLRLMVEPEKFYIFVIDEAQSLSIETLNRLANLTGIDNAFPGQVKLLLVGRPELDTKLKSEGCEGLQSSIGYRHVIPALDLEDSLGYIHTRLEKAGGTSSIFSVGAVGAIYGFSNGFPRDINKLAGNSLLAGAVKGEETISAETVSKCYEDFRLGKPFIEFKSEGDGPKESTKERRNFRGVFRKALWAVILTMVMLLALAFGVRLLHRPLLRESSVDQTRDLATTGRGTGPAAKAEDQKRPTGPADKTRLEERVGALKSVEISEKSKKGDGPPKGAVIPGTEGKDKEEFQRSKDGEVPYGPIAVPDAAICRNVLNQKPVDPGNVFERSVGRLFCFTAIEGANRATYITHDWYLGDDLISRVKLPVRSEYWRTHSYINLEPGSAGQWHVKILDPEGKILETLHFRILS